VVVILTERISFPVVEVRGVIIESLPKARLLVFCFGMIEEIAAGDVK
jgi:hypothetical protein